MSSTELDDIEKLICDFERYESDFLYQTPAEFIALMRRFMVIQVEWLKRMAEKRGRICHRRRKLKH